MINTDFVDLNALEKHLGEFSKFVESNGYGKFEGFSNRYIIQEEGYKKEVWSVARRLLAFQMWKKDSIGNGDIWKCLLLSLSENNNLVDYRDVVKIKSIKPTQELEKLFYDLVKGTGDIRGRSFDSLLNNNITQRLLSFFLFLVDDKQYVPLAPETFDVAFETIVVHGFKTNRHGSWDNYLKFIQIVKEVRYFLQNKLHSDVSLLDAHSFLWRLTRDLIGKSSEGSKKENEPVAKIEVPKSLANEIDKKENQDVVKFEVGEEFDENVFPEGKEVYVQHKKKERNTRVVKEAKERALKADQTLPCKICGFSFFKTYGELGIGFIEAHHIQPLSEIEGETETKVEDLILVCSNCHRMLHRKRPWITHGNLAGLIDSIKFDSNQFKK